MTTRAPASVGASPGRAVGAWYSSANTPTTTATSPHFMTRRKMTVTKNPCMSAPGGGGDSDGDDGDSGPVVVVLGATGTGKTKLSLEVARRFHGEVVNADALQVYEGLPIATNKAPAAERGDVPHHLLGSVPADTAITVHECGLRGVWGRGAAKG